MRKKTNHGTQRLNRQASCLSPACSHLQLHLVKDAWLPPYQPAPRYLTPSEHPVVFLNSVEFHADHQTLLLASKITNSFIRMVYLSLFLVRLNPVLQTDQKSMPLSPSLACSCFFFFLRSCFAPKAFVQTHFMFVNLRTNSSHAHHVCNSGLDIAVGSCCHWLSCNDGCKFFYLDLY